MTLSAAVIGSTVIHRNNMATIDNPYKRPPQPAVAAAVAAVAVFPTNVATMGPQSQRRLTLKERTHQMKSDSPKKKLKAGDQQTLFGDRAFDPKQDCEVCKGKLYGRDVHRAHHKLCWNNRKTKGVVSTTTLDSIQEEKRLKQHFSDKLANEDMFSSRHMTKEATVEFFAPRQPPAVPQKETSTISRTCDKPPVMTATAFCDAVTRKVSNNAFVEEHKQSRAPLAMLAFAGSAHRAEAGGAHPPDLPAGRGNPRRGGGDDQGWRCGGDRPRARLPQPAGPARGPLRLRAWRLPRRGGSFRSHHSRQIGPCGAPLCRHRSHRRGVAVRGAGADGGEPRDQAAASGRGHHRRLQRRTPHAQRLCVGRQEHRAGHRDLRAARLRLRRRVGRPGAAQGIAHVELVGARRHGRRAEEHRGPFASAHPRPRGNLVHFQTAVLAGPGVEVEVGVVLLAHHDRVARTVGNVLKSRAIFACERSPFTCEDMNRCPALFGHAGRLKHRRHLFDQRLVMVAVPRFIQMKLVEQRSLVQIGQYPDSPTQVALVFVFIVNPIVVRKATVNILHVVHRQCKLLEVVFQADSAPRRHAHRTQCAIDGFAVEKYCGFLNRARVHSKLTGQSGHHRIHFLLPGRRFDHHLQEFPFANRVEQFIGQLHAPNERDTRAQAICPPVADAGDDEVVGRDAAMNEVAILCSVCNTGAT